MLRGLVDNVLSGMKAGFIAILNLEHPIERKKMFNLNPAIAHSDCISPVF